MQMLNQEKIKKINFKKSQLLLFGSLLIFVGIYLVSYKHLVYIKSLVDSDMNILISDNININDENLESIEPVKPIKPIEPVEPIKPVEPVPEVVPKPIEKPKPVPPPINYDKYLGVLEIPRISLKRGFYGLDSSDNNITKNVTLVKGSNMPDINNGNLILMAHSGDSYISYFAYLHRLRMGSDIYVTYKKTKYRYKLVNKYDVEKNGKVSIIRNYDKTTLTLITCTVDDSTKQTIYIAELV